MQPGCKCKGSFGADGMQKHVIGDSLLLHVFEMFGYNSGIHKIDLEGGGAGESVKERVCSLVKLYGTDYAACHHAPPITPDVAFHAGNYLDAGTTVFQYNTGHYMFLGPIIGCLLQLLCTQAV